MINLVIFDLDGTLIDSMSIFADIAAKLIHQNYNWTIPRARQEYLATSGLPFSNQLELLFPNHPLNQKINKEFEIEKSKLNIPVPEESLTLLHELKARNIKTAISSSTSQQLLEKFMQKQALPVDLALGFRPGFPKGKEHFNYCKQHFKIQKSKTLFVGDSLHDAQVAQDNKINFIGKIGTFTASDFKKKFSYPLIAKLPDLLNYV
jgi:phosphoglycolate phosphatase-like HAD superfamily hydrolase